MDLPAFTAPNNDANVNIVDDNDDRVFLAVVHQAKSLGCACVDVSKMQLRLGSWMVSDDDVLPLLQRLKHQVKLNKT